MAESLKPSENNTPIPGTVRLPDFDIDAVNQLIRLRRSIFTRQMSDEAIPREKIELILENAHWAPNHGHTEPWFFKVFSGDARAKIGAAHAALYEAETTSETFSQKSYDKLFIRPTQCSHVIAICMRRGDNPKIPEIEEVAAVAAAVQNMHLTATALGIGAYWSSGGKTYSDGMKEILGLRPEDKCLGFFYLGYLKGSWPEGSRKTGWEAKVVWEE